MLSHHVTSLELSKKLKELGVKQESLFCWGKDGKRLHASTDGYGSLHWQEPDECSAYLASELGKWLPENVTTNGKGTVTVSPEIEGPTMMDILDEFKPQEGMTEADGRAQILIILITSGLIDLPKV